MCADTLLSERGKAGVDLRRDYVAGVVLRDQVQCFVLVPVESSRGEGVDVDVVAGDIPIDFVGGGEVGHPGFRPALETGGCGFTGVGGRTRSQRLKDMEGVPVTEGPYSEWQDGH